MTVTHDPAAAQQDQAIGMGHDLVEIMAHADRLVLLSRGRVVRDGHPREVLSEVERFGVRLPDAVRLGGDFRSWLN